MPGFQDSAFLVLLALLLFGPKKLPVLARQLGKLMGDFRRASNEFRAQMEDELRIAEQADRQKEIAKLEAAAPKPALMAPAETSSEEGHAASSAFESDSETHGVDAHEAAVDEPAPAPLPIATSGELKIMPPATGLPVANTSLAPFLDSIPAVDSNGTAASHNGAESPGGGATAVAELLDEAGTGRGELPVTNHSAEHETEARPWMIFNPVDRARKAISDRAELPGMSLMEHLEELRKRLIHAFLYLMAGFAVGWFYRVQLYGIIKRPLDNLHLGLVITHPTDALNLYLKTALVGGAILASPFILYQLWLFIAPGMYSNEKKYVMPFMGATVFLFLAGAWFGYRYVIQEAIKVLIFDFGKGFTSMLTIEDYTGFFLAVILGLGVCFELPIVIFFLALFGIVDAKFLAKNYQYAVLGIFIVAAIICPLPDPLSMCAFASPMLALYGVSIGIAYFVHPNRRKAKEKAA